MASFSRSRFFRACLALFSFGAPIFVGFYGVSLIAEGFDPSGSIAGNAVLFVLGLILLVLAPVVFIAGIVLIRK